MINFDLINSVALSSLPSLVQQWIPGGHLNGKEYVVRNPVRPDKDEGSFSINTNTGVWKDFSCNDGGANPISLYAYINRINKYYDAAKELSELLHIDSSTKPPLLKKAATDIWTPIVPAPSDAPAAPPTCLRPVGKAWVDTDIVQKWAYLDKKGSLLGYDIKTLKKSGGKEILPFTYCKSSSGEYAWRTVHFKGNRPLFNLDRLETNRNATVIVVEGCKCAEALQKLLDDSNNKDYVTTTWPGGCQSTINVDWKPLQNRNIYVWPDNDRKFDKNNPDIEKPKIEQDGYKAALTILKETKAIVKSQKLIEVMGVEKPDTWDVADAIYDDKWNMDQILVYFENFLIDPPISKKTDKPRITQKQPPFKCLGYNKGYFHYLNKQNRIITIGEGGHTSLMLLNLAPKEFWKSLFYKDEGKVNWEDAADFLQNHPDSEKTYIPSKCRGRGVYVDNGRVVCHMGDRLLVDFKELSSFNDLESEYVYVAGEKISFDLENPLSDNECVKLLDIIEKLYFVDPTMAIFLAGYIALAPICGALDWRPHIWLTGGPGTGKSTILQKLVNPCIGDFKIYVKSATTAPAMRQTMGLDAIPTINDEFEGHDMRSKARVADVLELARASSSEDDAKLLKGTTSHKPVAFAPRSPFLLSSTGVNIDERADETRISIAELQIPKKMTQIQRNEHWNALEKEIAITLTPEYCSRLRARLILNVMNTRENFRTFSKIVSEQLGEKRPGDQYGSLIAGCYSLTHTGKVDLVEAEEFVKTLGLTNIYDKGTEDQNKLLDFILQHTLKIDNVTELSIEEIIRKITDRSSNFYDCLDEKQVQLYDLLKRNGIRIDHVEANKTKWMMWVSDSHGGIGRMLADSSWPKKWGLILKRMPNAIQSPAMRFIGSPTRATGIPLEEVL